MNILRIKKIILLILRGEWPYLFHQLALKTSGVLSSLSNEKSTFAFENDQSLTLQEQQEIQAKNVSKTHSIAMLVHVYYPDVFLTDIAPLLKQLNTPYDLFLTVPQNMGKQSFLKIRELFPEAHFYFYENKGRDIFPFLYLFPTFHLLRYEWVCKLHTKKSTHLNYGKVWRQSLYRSLIHPQQVASLRSRPSSLGLLAPPHSLLPLDIFMGQNKNHVQLLRDEFEIPVLAQRFVAGSMFWFRPEALRDLLRHDSSSYARQCDPEQGQVDGTQAHAYERIFSSLALKAGYETQASSGH